MIATQMRHFWWTVLAALFTKWADAWGATVGYWRSSGISSRVLRGVGLVAVVCSLQAAGAVRAQDIDQNMWGTGYVRAIVRDGGVVYIGGSFSSVYRVTGGGVQFDAGSGALPAVFPKVNGTVRAVASDGVGGWYIGGTFSAVGGVPRSGVAHIASDLTLTAWDPNAVLSPGLGVSALALSGSTVYAVGNFTSIGGQPRNGLAALDVISGAATSWNPGASGTVLALAVDGSTVYVGGSFTNIGGQPRSRIAAIDAATGVPTAWNPNANSSVNALAVSGSTVYVGGIFTTIGGQARNRVAALDATTGAATTWNPNASSTVNTLAVSGSTVYVGGQFTTIGGQARNRVAALDATTGAATTWNPNANGTVYTLAVSGLTVYAGGSFNSIGGQPRNRIAALDATTGSATALDPNLSGGAAGSVFALAVDGSTIYAGGSFNGTQAQGRNGLAALDATTGALTAWNPLPAPANSWTNALAVSGSTVYVGGNFTSIGGQPRNGLAALDVTTGAATAWDPNADSGTARLAVSGSTVYVAGGFTTIGGQPRNGLAAIDVTTGAATPWNPNPNPSGSVFALAVDGSTVYTCGYFTNIGGQPRNLIAALDATTGTATAWDPNAGGPQAFPTVYALAVDGSTVYVGGNFTSIGGQPRNLIAALDATTGTATAWNPNPSGSVVYALALTGSRLYVGGSFSSIGGQPHYGLAALDATTGAATTWDPHPSPPVEALAASGSTVYAGGQFSSIGMLPHGGFAAITDDQASAVPLGPNSPETVRAWPNPFVNRVSLAFGLSVAMPVQMDVFDISGRRVWSSAQSFLGPGGHTFSWDGAAENGARASAGRYFIRLRGLDLEVTKAVVRLR